MENQYIKKATTPYHFDEGDDGSLASLGLDTDRERKSFSCHAVRQTELVDKKIWVLDFFGDIKGKDGKMKYIFKAKFNLEDDESKAFKVWTGSQEIFYILDKIVPSVVARVG